AFAPPSLHDALPICRGSARAASADRRPAAAGPGVRRGRTLHPRDRRSPGAGRPPRDRGVGRWPARAATAPRWRRTRRTRHRPQVTAGPAPRAGAAAPPPARARRHRARALAAAGVGRVAGAARHARRRAPALRHHRPRAQLALALQRDHGPRRARDLRVAHRARLRAPPLSRHRRRTHPGGPARRGPGPTPGRRHWVKAHAVAIARLAALRAGGSDARLWRPGVLQAGREGYADELRALARAAGVEAVLELGPATDAIAAAYAGCDLVLQLSRKPEAFGRTVIEALSVGRAVAGWDHGGVGELLRELQPAGAVPPFDMAQLVQAARALLAQPPALPDTMDYTLRSMQDATLHVYDELRDDRDHTAR